MTLTQRLTRAGLSFIVFGTAVSLMPTNGMAFSATDGCTTPAQTYSVGSFSGDSSTFYSTYTTGLKSKSISLTQFFGGNVTHVAISAIDSNPSFKTKLRYSTVTTTTTAAKNHTDTVTVTFPKGRVVHYTVTAN